MSKMQHAALNQALRVTLTSLQSLPVIEQNTLYRGTDAYATPRTNTATEPQYIATERFCVGAFGFGLVLVESSVL